MYKDKDYLYQKFVVERKSSRQIAKEIGLMEYKRVEYYLTKYNLYGIRTRIKHSLNDDKLNFKFPIFCYYCGLIATDGYVDRANNRVSLRLKNRGAEFLLNNLKEYLEFTGEVREYRGSYDLTITSKKLIELLDKLSVSGNSFDVEVPNKFPHVKCLQMFLRGILDGDGNINLKYSKKSGNYYGGQFRVVKGSILFIEGLIKLINSNVGTNCEMSYATVRGTTYPKIELRVKDSIKFYNYVYQGFTDFRLPDKYEKYQCLIR